MNNEEILKEKEMIKKIKDAIEALKKKILEQEKILDQLLNESE